MKVREFVMASFLSMTFKEDLTEHIIYEFTWDDDCGEEDFLEVYGDCTVISFRSVTDGLIDVYIEVYR